MTKCKYKKLKQQQSLDGGNSWIDVYQLGVLVTKKGDLIASNSSDCGYMGEYIRWVETTGYICYHTTHKKYAKERKQTSTDGINWTDTNEYRQGRLLEENSKDCGYAPPLEPDTQYKWVDSGFECGSNLSSDSTIVMEAPGELTKETVYRWVVANGNDDYVCDGNVKHYLYVRQQSTDGGLNWSEVQPRETQKGAVMSNDSKDCRCKTVVTYTDGTTNEYKLEGALNVWDIGDRQNVKYISLGTCVTSIPDASFDNWDNMERIDIPNTITSIGNRAFAGLEKLSTLTIPSSVTSIGAKIFENSLKITEITYQGTKAQWIAITKNANWNMNSMLTTIHCKDGDLTVEHPYDKCETRGQYFQFDDKSPIVNFYTINGELSKGSVPENKYEYKHLRILDIGTCVTSIGAKAFYGYCYPVVTTHYEGLSAVKIPSTVTSIGNEAFGNCYALKSINFPDSLKSIGSSAFTFCSGLTTVEIGEGVESIGERAFYGCSGMTSLMLKNGIKEIGINAFNFCNKLSSITIPGSVETLGVNAFSSCSGLTAVTIENGVKEISNSAFEYCKNLSEANLPSSLISIGSNAFNDCKLTALTIPDSVKTIGSVAFGGNDFTSIKIPNGVKKIELKTFASCSNLATVDIPSSITAIGSQAFAGCKKLTSFNFEGTTSQWNSITKGELWDDGVPATVVRCTDGNVAI